MTGNPPPDPRRVRPAKFVRPGIPPTDSTDRPQLNLTEAVQAAATKRYERINPGKVWSLSTVAQRTAHIEAVKSAGDIAAALPLILNAVAAAIEENYAAEAGPSDATVRWWEGYRAATRTHASLVRSLEAL